MDGRRRGKKSWLGKEWTYLALRFSFRQKMENDPFPCFVTLSAAGAGGSGAVSAGLAGGCPSLAAGLAVWLWLSLAGGAGVAIIRGGRVWLSRCLALARRLWLWLFVNPTPAAIYHLQKKVLTEHFRRAYTVYSGERGGDCATTPQHESQSRRIKRQRRKPRKGIP